MVEHQKFSFEIFFFIFRQLRREPVSADDVDSDVAGTRSGCAGEDVDEKMMNTQTITDLNVQPKGWVPIHLLLLILELSTIVVV